jgi:presenilin-like A22 family membrane protease
MKHTLPVTLLLISVFLLAQLVGLGLIAAGTHVQTDASGNRVVSHDETAIGPRPDTQGFGSFLYLIIGVAIGTVVILVLVKYRLAMVWKLWFFVAVWLATSVSVGALVPKTLAFVIGFGLAYWKIWKPNILIHNITEVLVYSGIALLIAPIFDVFWASMLLIAIAIYDAYAVWQSRHMVSMAQFQTETKLFAGLLIPYQRKTVTISPQPQLAVKPVEKPQENKSAILGGGDIAFPMLFAGAVLDGLVKAGLTPFVAYVQSLAVVLCAMLALLLLFLYAKQDRFYPAMPFLSAGCFVGYGIVVLMHLL